MSKVEGASRIYCLDMYKGFMIFAIVMLHVIFQSQAEGGNVAGQFVPQQFPGFMQFIYIGLMSFFIIAGYFYRPGRNPLKYIRKRLMQIGIPVLVGLLVLPLVLWAYLAVFGQSASLDYYFESILEGVLYWDWFQPFTYVEYRYNNLDAAVGYYFLYVIMWASVLFFPIASKVVGDTRKTAIAIAVLVAISVPIMYGVHLPFNLHSAPVACAFMLFGAYLGNRDYAGYAEDTSNWKTSKFWLIMLGCIAVGIILCYVFQPGINFDRGYFGPYGGASVVPYFVIACIAAIAYIPLSAVVGRIPVISTVFCELGKHTLGILLLNIFMAKIILAPFMTIPIDKNLPTMGMTTCIIVAILTLALSYLVCIASGKVLERLNRKE